MSDEILALDLGRVVVRDRPDVVLHDPRWWRRTWAPAT
jgi:hypothetical protein